MTVMVINDDDDDDDDDDDGVKLCGLESSGKEREKI